MNPWNNHTIGMSQHREYETRYGEGGPAPTQTCVRRKPSALSLVQVLGVLSVVTFLL